MSYRNSSSEQARAKTFWSAVQDELGAFDYRLKLLFMQSGFNSKMAFKGHFSRGIAVDDVVKSFENLVKGLDDDSPLLAAIRVKACEKENFKLEAGEVGTIYGIFEGMKPICDKDDPFPNSSTSRSVVPSSSSRQSTITIANAASEVIKAIRRRLPMHISHEDPDPEVLDTDCDHFPFSVKVKCIKCYKIYQISISKDKRRDNKYNIQTLKYAKHVKRHD